MKKEKKSEDMAPVKSLIDLWLNPPACTIQLDSAVLYVLFCVTIITMLPCMDRKINKNENERKSARSVYRKVDGGLTCRRLTLQAIAGPGSHHILRAHLNNEPISKLVNSSFGNVLTYII